MIFFGEPKKIQQTKQTMQMISILLGIVISVLCAQVTAQAGDFEVVIVGSGFGGSIAAKRLADAGQRALILERGRSWTVTDPSPAATGAPYCTLNAPDGRAAWFQNNSGFQGFPYAGKVVRRSLILPLPFFFADP